MRTLYRVLLGIACCVMAVCPVVAQSTSATNNSGATASTELPDSPGTIWAQSQEPVQESRSSGQDSSSAQTNSAQTSPPQTESPAATQDQKLQRPVGTAAAEAPKVTGITGAHPAGVAIAPAKQRRVRIIVLKVGAIIGAGAAVGTVIALSAATPSKPPGAR